MAKTPAQRVKLLESVHQQLIDYKNNNDLKDINTKKNLYFKAR